jgi:outer membrane receptor for ferrienterochelin and colicins
MKMKIYFIGILLLINYKANAQVDTVLKETDLSGFSLEDLLNVKVITASGSEQTVKEAPSTIRVITAKQIEERGYEQLEDVLRDMEGIDVIHLGGYTPSIFYFRGLYGAENLRALLLIDGIRENNLVGSSDLSGPAYSLHNVKRIEIIWGPESALYGADAFGGVINIITKKGAEINGVHYEKGYGSFNTSADRLMIGTKRKKIDFAFSGSLYNTDGPRYINRDPYYNASYVSKARSFNGEVTYTSKKIISTLGFRAYDTPMGWGNFLNSSTKILGLPSQGYQNSGTIGLVTQDVRNEKPNLYDAFSHTIFLQTQYTPSNKLNFSGCLSYRKTGVDDKSYIYISIDTNLLPGVSTKYIYRAPVFNYSYSYKADISAVFSPFLNHKIYAGIQFFEDNLESGNRKFSIDTNKYMIDGMPITNLYPVMNSRVFTIRNNLGTYLQYVVTTNMLNKTSFTAGFRFDKNTNYKNPITPRLVIINQPNTKCTIKLLYGTAFRAPTPSEIDAQIITFGSKAARPEKVSTYEVSFIYHSSSKLMLQVNVFDNWLKDIYVQNSVTGEVFGSNQNIGKANVYGAEATVEIYRDKMFSGFANYTFQEGMQTDLKTGDSFTIPNLPYFKGNAGITYHGTKLFTITAIGNWVGKRILPHTNPYGADKEYKMGGYFLTNVVLTSKKLFNNRVSVSINVKNIFNVHYLDPGIRTADGVLYSTVMEQPGINVLFKISVDLI